MANNIFVVGGTGTIGQSLIEVLQKENAQFTALARSEEKAAALREQGVDVLIGNLGDWSGLAPHLKHYDTAFLLTGPSPEQVALQNGFIDLAKEQGIKKIVKVSAIGASAGSSIHLADWHGQIEDHLKDSGLEYIIVQPHSFIQNTLMNVSTIKDQGVLYQSLGDAKIPMVDTRDVAQACAACLLSNTFNNRTFQITGGNPIGYQELVDAISDAVEKPIRYVAIPPEAHNQAMKEAGLPDWLADDLTGMSAYWSQTPVHEPSPDFEKLTGNKQYTLQDFARDYAGAFK